MTKTNLRYFPIIAVISLSLACGVNTQLSYSQNTSEVITQVKPTQTSEPVLNYEVTAETLQIRDGAGEEFAPLGYYLERGDIVTCQTVETAIDGGRWCKHDLGWSNIRYMKGK